jgi:hypothetical protein
MYERRSCVRFRWSLSEHDFSLNEAPSYRGIPHFALGACKTRVRLSRGEVGIR